jgi:hypothetical protein
MITVHFQKLVLNILHHVKVVYFCNLNLKVAPKDQETKYEQMLLETLGTLKWSHLSTLVIFQSQMQS